MNGEPDDIPEALRDRFPVRIEVDRPSKQALKALPKRYQKLCEKAYTREGGPMLLTYRALFEFTGMLERGLEEAMAAQAVWGKHYIDVLTQVKLGSLE
jgi:hypothetical protein